MSSSNLGWVIFGPSLSLFSTWTGSFVTMTRVALGEFDNIYPLMVEINDAAAFIIIATYQVNMFTSTLLSGPVVFTEVFTDGMH